MKGINMYKKGFCSFGLLLVFVLSSCGPATSTGPTALPVNLAPGKRVVGYYAQWAAERGSFVSSIPANKITHINYAFSNVSDQGECILGDETADIGRVFTAKESVNGKADSPDATALHGNFNQLEELKTKYPHLKVLISVGGYEWSGNFSNTALTDASRKTFVKSCIDLYLTKYKGVFDGIDIDWEYPGGGGLTEGRPEDRDNFALLLAEFRQEMDDLGNANGTHYLLTIAVGGGPSVVQNYAPKNFIQYLDWANVMTYDFHGTWEGVTNFNAPLYETSAAPADASLNAAAAVQYYLKAGIPADKLVMGVPFYGRGWKGVPDIKHGLYDYSQGAATGKFEEGAFNYTELKNDYIATYTRYWDAQAQVPWLYNPATQIFISYDDPESIAAKAGYANDQGLGGVMIWELSQGDADMLDAIQRGFNTGGLAKVIPTKDPNAIIIPRPFKSEIHSISGITVDGNLSDWPADPTFTFKDKSQVVYSLSSNSWGGPQDLSAEAWAGWTTDGFYFASKVVDDKLVQTQADSNLWHGDYVEWQFDTQLDKDYDDKSMNDDDYQIGISPGDFANVPPVAYAWFNGPDIKDVINIQQAQVRTASGYILEIFIPKGILKGITLEEGAKFGMNISPSDADDPVQGQKVMMSTSAIRTYADPRTFGEISLVK
jgi:GH18 family chitinase